MDETLAQDKKALRTRMKQALAAQSPSLAADLSQAAAHRLVTHPVFAAAKLVMIYLPLPGEIDPTPIAVAAWRAGKRVAVPLAAPEGSLMTPIELSGLDEPMESDRFGIRTPLRRVEVPVSLIDLLVTPGLAFDRSGGRLGRGKGYYDRFIARPDFAGAACGLAFELQVIDLVPAGPYDMKLSMLVTDRRLIDLSEAGPGLQPPGAAGR